jgi:integrase
MKVNSASDLSKQITEDSISAFMFSYIDGHAHGGCADMCCSARSFLKYCYLYKLLDRDLSALVPTTRCWQLPHIPKAVSEENICKLLNSIGDCSAIDLRDKAIITLLVVYGVRGAQIRRLCLNDLDWESGQIHFPAVKGGRSLNQAMTVEVGNCLSAYLLKGRPQSSFPEVFLIDFHSVYPLGGPQALSSIVSHRFKRAGIQQAEGVSYGTHGFRHAFASRLVGVIPFHELNEMLGHKSPSSTFLYSKVAFSMQREAALPWPKEV